MLLDPSQPRCARECPAAMYRCCNPASSSVGCGKVPCARCSLGLSTCKPSARRRSSFCRPIRAFTPAENECVASSRTASPLPRGTVRPGGFFKLSVSFVPNSPGCGFAVGVRIHGFGLATRPTIALKPSPSCFHTRAARVQNVGMVPNLLRAWPACSPARKGFCGLLIGIYNFLPHLGRLYQSPFLIPRTNPRFIHIPPEPLQHLLRLLGKRIVPRRTAACVPSIHTQVLSPHTPAHRRYPASPACQSAHPCAPAQTAWGT